MVDGIMMVESQTETHSMELLKACPQFKAEFQHLRKRSANSLVRIAGVVVVTVKQAVCHDNNVTLFELSCMLYQC